MNLLNRVLKSSEIINFFKICLVGAELFRVDGWTDMMKLISTFSNFVNAPKTCLITERPRLSSLVTVCLVTLSVVQWISHQMLEWLTHNEWGRMWKEVVVFQNFHVGAEKNHKEAQIQSNVVTILSTKSIKVSSPPSRVTNHSCPICVPKQWRTEGGGWDVQASPKIPKF
jgi:hypothetical protein